MRHALLSLLGALLVGAQVAPLPLEAQDPDCEVVVYPPHSTVLGRTIGEWSAEWWKWVLSTPADRNPLTDETGEFAHEGQEGPVFFLAGNLGGATERTITIPCGVHVFVPLLNMVEWAPDDCLDCKECSTKATGIVNARSLLECEIDGVSVVPDPVPDLFEHREDTSTSECFGFVAPEENPLGALRPGEEYSIAASAGYWLLLAPLCPGPHTIHWKGVTGPIEAPAFVGEITYHLNSVVYPPHSRVLGKTLGDWGAEWWK